MWFFLETVWREGWLKGRETAKALNTKLSFELYFVGNRELLRDYVLRNEMFRNCLFVFTLVACIR